MVRIRRAVRSQLVRSLVLAVALTVGRAAAAEAPPAAAPAPAAAEPIWETVVLAPGRVVGFGRFGAALPSYHAARAEGKAKAEAEKAERCSCPCAAPR